MLSTKMIETVNPAAGKVIMICLREVIVYIRYKVVHELSRRHRNSWHNLIHSFLCELLLLMQKVGQRIDKRRQAKQVYVHNIVTCDAPTRLDLRSQELSSKRLTVVLSE